MRTTTRKPTRKRTRPPLSRAPSFWRRVRRFILWCSGCLFVSITVLVYHTTQEPLSSRTGQALTWSAGQFATPLLARVPWWWWLGVGTVAVYLWIKHKLIMSVVFAVCVGIYLATL